MRWPIARVFLPLFLSGLLAAPALAEAVRVLPSRMTLGGLSYGSSKTEILQKKVVLDFKEAGSNPRIVQVDFSKAPGIRLKETNEEPGKIELVFEVDANQFTKGQPFGKFLKAPIRIETDSARVPQVVIPVVAWLSINETDRNFNQFLFQGSRRWQGPWGTPNIAGAVLVPFILFVAGGLAWSGGLLARGGGKNSLQKHPVLTALAWAGLLVMGGLAFWLLFLLGHTYSRGSWIALGAGLAVFLAGKGSLRWMAVAVALVFLGIICTLPAGVDRVGSYTRVEEDKSIANRFRLWAGALQAMAEYPLRGVGPDRFGPVFKKDYQVFEHKVDNSTAVSDFMTFGAERGLPFVGLASGLLLFLLSQTLWARKTLFLVPGAMLASSLAASAFSTLWFVGHYQGLFVFSVAGLVLGLAWTVRNATEQRRVLMGLLKTASLFVLGSLLGWSLMAWAALHQLPTRGGVLAANGAGKSEAWVEESRHLPIRGTILYLADENDGPLLAHTTLRPLASLGWRVVWPGLLEQDQVMGWVQRLKERYPGAPVFVAGHGHGGRQAWLAVSQQEDLLLKGGGCGFLTDDLEPELSGKRPSSSFLVFQSLYDDQVSANASIRAQKGLAFAGLPLEVVLVPDLLGRFSPAWLEWHQTLNRHFSASPGTHSQFLPTKPM